MITHNGNAQTKQLNSITLNGGGFGHGVGLSQYGAGFLSKQGLLYPQIIKHYYRGVQLGTVPLTVNAQYPNKQLVFSEPTTTKVTLKAKTSNSNTTVLLSLNGKNIPLGNLSKQPISTTIDLKQLKALDNQLSVKLPTPNQTVQASVWLEFE